MTFWSFIVTPYVVQHPQNKLVHIITEAINSGVCTSLSSHRFFLYLSITATLVQSADF